MKIRRAQPTDAPGIISTHVRSIRECCAADYTPEQIKAWSGREFKPEIWHATIEKDAVWVVEDDQKQICGFGHLSFFAPGEAEICGLYFMPEVAGKGLGKQMAELFFAEAAKHQVKRITLSSTITSKPFYEKLGFKEIPNAQRFEVLGGVKIPCQPMQKVL